MILSALVLEHPQARRHGREGRGAAHDVLAEGHVHMSDREDDEHVHERMVDGAHRLNVPEEREHPAEPGHPGFAPTPRDP